MAITEKMNNRVIQSYFITYKTKSEISEALFLLRQYVNESTYKWLSHFIYTGQGATQAKNSTICAMSGVPESTYYATVRPEIEGLFEEPLIIRRAAPRKLDHSRTKRVRASEFKILQPLKKIKYLIDRKLQEERQVMIADREAAFFVPGVEFGAEFVAESNPESPCQISAQEPKIDEEKKSFRKNRVDLHNHLITGAENPGNPPVKATRKIKIKTEIINYLNNFPVFRDFKTWSESKRYDIARTIQLAVIKTNTDIQEIKSQHMIKGAIARLMAEYQNKPLSEFLKLLYTFVFNALNDAQEDEPEAPEDEPENKSDEPLSLWDQMKPTFRRLLDEKPIDDRTQEEKKAEIERMLRELEGGSASRDELDALGVF